jgi:hypothetical protein
VDSFVVNPAGRCPGERATGPVYPTQPSAPGVGSGRAGGTYVRRQPEHTVLHRGVRKHPETFLAEVELRGGGQGVPRFVERELREFLNCGVLARGLARFRCGDCPREIPVAFSCKGRDFCPSCCGRRMAERGALGGVGGAVAAI